MIFWNILNQQMLIGNWVITYICKHNNSIFIVSDIRPESVYFFYGFIKSMTDGCPSWLKILIDRLPDLFFIHFWNIIALDHCPGLIMEYNKRKYIILFQFFEKHKYRISREH